MKPSAHRFFIFARVSIVSQLFRPQVHNVRQDTLILPAVGGMA